MRKDNKIKLVFTDYDETFCDNGKEPSKEALDVKDTLLNNGAKVVLVSGRPVKEIKIIAKKYNFSNIFITELGSILFINGEEILNHGNLRKYVGCPKYKEFINYLDSEKINSHDAIFKIKAVDLVLNEAIKNKQKLRLYTPRDGFPGDPETNTACKKGSVLLRGFIDVQPINSFLEVEAPFLEVIDNALVSDETEHAYYLIIKGANKESAARIIQQKLNIREENTIGLGDSFADLALSLISNKFILMKNAFNHSPKIMEDFKEYLYKVLSLEYEVNKVLDKVIISKKEGSLAWAEEVNKLFLAQ
jgi:HAD superfamily hydrolase (TIGR01484 family)